MSLEFVAMLPMLEDGVYSDAWSLVSIARAAEVGGFSTLLLPAVSGMGDWSIAANLAAETRTLRFLVPLRDEVEPAVAAQQATTFDHLSGGRLSLNVATDSAGPDHAAGYRRSREFIHVIKRLFTESRINHDGEFYHLSRASLFPRPAQRPHPPFFIAGDSDAGKDVVANEAQVYLASGASLDEMRRHLGQVRAAVNCRGREVHYSATFEIILGDTEAEAWRRADEQRRYINLWDGRMQVRDGQALALVGTPDQVADRILEYVALGLEYVALSGFPQLETIERLGREVLPRVRARLAERPSPRLALPVYA